MMFCFLDDPDVVRDILGSPLGKVPGSAAAGHRVHGEILFICEQDDWRFFLQKIEQDLGLFEPDSLQTFS